MRYIANGLFDKHSGKPFKIKDMEDDVPEHDASIAEVLKVTLAFYDNEHKIFVQLGKVLTAPSEAAAFNRIMDVLKEAPEEGYIAFESEDFTILQKLIGWTVPQCPWWRDGALIDELLTKAPKTLPESDMVDVDKDSPGADAAASNGTSNKVGASKKG